MSIVYSIENTAEDRIHSIEKEREAVLTNPEFIQWCKDMNIGSRVERITEERVRASELMNQYGEKYTKYLKQS